MRAGVALTLALVACAPTDGIIFVENDAATATSSDPGSSDTGLSTGLASTGALWPSGSGADTSTNGTAADQTTTASTTGSPSCLELPVVLRGGDVTFMHRCGELCDVDWCSCEPCMALYGPLGALPTGMHTLVILGGASGMIDYELELTLAEDTIVLERFAYDGLFTHEIPIEIPPGCGVVEIRIDQGQDLCSRIYDVRVNP